VATAASAAQSAAVANFNAFKELLSEDGLAASMWLHDDNLLSTLLRLCHTMYLHPLVCVIGGWAHFPLLSLVSRFYGGEEVRMCTRVTAEALEHELFGGVGAAGPSGFFNMSTANGGAVAARNPETDRHQALRRGNQACAF
jgi:hypothetical protein